MAKKMTKREKTKFDKLMANIAKVTNTDQTVLEEAHRISTLYTQEDRAYEMQSVLNFYRARVEPFLEKGEKPEDFDKRFREWRFKVCNGCGERFAYAYTFDDVGCCSLECLEKSLAKIGIIYSRHKDLTRRWGYRAHPAIVSSYALQSLEGAYPQLSFLDDETLQTPLPTHHPHHDSLPIQGTLF